jgi:3-deoxy-D-manno-octulosonate 8-phosphate phosphatase (KDO 8-P phosphatase)
MTATANEMSLVERCRRIELLLLDVDGVLTDGGITYTDQGAEIKTFHVRDGSGLKFWSAQGKKAGIITGRRSAIVERRAQELGIHAVIQGAGDKKAACERLLHEHGLKAEQACYIGDDLPDVPVMQLCGLGVAVADACPEAKQAAHFTTHAAGGRGAVREAIEWIMRAQGSWQALVAHYCDV